MASSGPSTMPVDTTDRANAVVLPVFAALAILITYFPLRSFYQNRNFPACNLVFVAFLLNLTVIVNAALWPNGDWSKWWMGQGLCDLQVYTKIPFTTAVATSLLCLTMGLSDAINVDKHNFNTTAAYKRRAFLCQIALCWTLPLLQIGLFYVVQVSRYVIAPVYGCGVLVDTSWVTMVIFIIWAPIASLISAYHAVLIIVRLRKHRANLSNALSSSNSGYTTRRYLKLFIMAVSLIIVFTPVEFYYLYLNIPPVFLPYSWSRVHNPLAWSAIIFLSTSDAPNLQYNGWISVALSFILFLFFGFNNDAVDTYRKWLVMCGLGRIWPSLTLPREEWVQRKGDSSGSSWSSRLDLVSKALHYFEGSRKRSQASSDGSLEGSDIGKYGNDSLATTDSVVLGTLNSTISHGDKYRHIPVAQPSSLNPDAITPVPSNHSQAPFLSRITEQLPAPTASPDSHKRNGILSVFRTHVNLPSPLFPPSRAKTADGTNGTQEQQQPARKTSHQAQDLEAQSPLCPSCRLSNPAATTISTEIWSDSSPAPAHLATSSDHGSKITHPALREEADPPAPLLSSPKLGTRAYRERERREQQQKRNMRASADSEIINVGGAGAGACDVDEGAWVVKSVRVERNETMETADDGGC